MTDPMDEVEVMSAIDSVAKAARRMYNSLREEGFDRKEALELTKAWLASITRPQS